MINKEITREIIRGFYKVYNKLGYGFLEKVYENALMVELKKLGFEVVQQKKIKVFYDGFIVGEYCADLIVNDAVVIELKSVEALCKEHKNQLINYLRSTEKEVGLLLNFGKEPEFQRVIFTNNNKNLCKSVKSASSVCH